MTKDHIISEIRRTAAENRGLPLGRERFFAETGIKEADWQGKYWVRWSDALREAGLEPNRMNSAVPDHRLLGKLAELIRELQHFPVTAELRMKARTDPEFPSHNTFRRFGGKAGLAAKLQTFAREQGYEDVAEICGRLAFAPDAEPESALTDDLEFGYVYLLRSGRFYKVGRSNAVGRRERELAIQLPEKARVVHSIKTDDPVGIENYWHQRFESRRKNGEWFELTAKDLAAFRRRKFM
jgi:hypothetical protein